MTADAFAEEKRKTLDAGMNYHLSKPINPPVFLWNIIRTYKVVIRNIAPLIVTNICI